MIERSSGVLAHVTMLPGPYGCGTFGKKAEEFIDLLADCGFVYWQVLPLSHPESENSPYTAYSAFALNPLLCVVYYDYLGLTYYRNYLNLHTEEYLLSATQATKTALEYAQKVDMHLQIWSAFLTYNLARFLSLQGDHEPAVQNIQTAVILRQELADSPFFTKELTHDLCFEYYLARIRQTEIEQRAGLLTAEAAQSEYRQIQAETEDAYGGTDSGDSRAYLKKLLHDRMQQP
jgi:hypothetical protein